jgi:hypothetical protein
MRINFNSIDFSCTFARLSWKLPLTARIWLELQNFDVSGLLVCYCLYSRHIFFFESLKSLFRLFSNLEIALLSVFAHINSFSNTDSVNVLTCSNMGLSISTPNPVWEVSILLFVWMVFLVILPLCYRYKTGHFCMFHNCIHMNVGTDFNTYAFDFSLILMGLKWKCNNYLFSMKFFDTLD